MEVARLWVPCVLQRPLSQNAPLWRVSNGLQAPSRSAPREEERLKTTTHHQTSVSVQLKTERTWRGSVCGVDFGMLAAAHREGGAIGRYSGHVMN